MSLDAKSPAAEKMNRSAAHWRVMHAAEDLLAACEADAAFLAHFLRCRDCSLNDVTGEFFCQTGRGLLATANTVRNAALQKAKGETP